MIDVKDNADNSDGVQGVHLVKVRMDNGLELSIPSDKVKRVRKPQQSRKGKYGFRDKIDLDNHKNF